MARWKRRRSWREIERLEDILTDEDAAADEWLDGARAGSRAVTPGAEPGQAPAITTPHDWKQHLASVTESMRQPDAAPRRWPAGRELLYVVDPDPPAPQHGLVIEVLRRDRRASGAWGKLAPLRLPWSEAAAAPDPADRTILSLLAAAGDEYGSWPAYRSAWEALPVRHRIPPPMQDVLVPLMCRTGRCRLQSETETPEETPLVWDDGEPWTFWLEVAPDVVSAERAERRAGYVVTGSLRRAGERMDVWQPVLLLESGLVLTRDGFARLDHRGAFPWIAHLRRQGPVRVPEPHGPSLVEAILRLPHVPSLDLPPDLRYEQIALSPRPRLRVRAGAREWGPETLMGALSFAYDDAVISTDEPGTGIFQASRRRLIVRDADVERVAAERLAALGFKPRSYFSGGFGTSVGLALAARHLSRVVAALLAEGWHVEADGKLYRQAGAVRLDVTSGVDWFDLHATVEFGDTVATLPALLAAVRRGERTVLLGDGTFGLLPEEWIKQYGGLVALGTPEEGHLRFKRSQIGVLDALLAAQPDAGVDQAFARARAELRTFDGIRPSHEPQGFVGVLRGYQREGVGWLHFLRRFGFGGCLADDMGLGKTIQVLALLAGRKAESDAAGPRSTRVPSLVVVPRSLIFNWKEEAARFTPALRVLDHTGTERARSVDHLRGYDIVLTTYGTLRRDVPHLKDLRFDYVILDEAQAIKNADTETAKAARLLTADHRLALSGTPVQNHLGELWSLFEFLNPGMLGRASALGLDGAAARNPDADTRELLARALRPVILRRTKEQVAPDLPARLEQTLHCQMDADQRAQYDELREHYRQALLGKVERDGVRRSAIQILEALLRLRQAACHPGLLDRSRTGEPSAKLEVLLSRIEEVVEEGHKALVFSQFTSFLAIVRARLDRDGVRYEYLDGKTRDRAARVSRFQGDPECRLFLVSLKAGGLGLNLTAADYVFLLDPWWNPAVEAQAIDRTHRIGQTRPVFAYRLITRDTVEEKVLALQESKRELADAIIRADGSLIGSLTREDLDLLLS